jgi:hypothetical protein
MYAEAALPVKESDPSVRTGGGSASGVGDGEGTGAGMAYVELAMTMMADPRETGMLLIVIGRAPAVSVRLPTTIAPEESADMVWLPITIGIGTGGSSLLTRAWVLFGGSALCWLVRNIAVDGTGTGAKTVLMVLVVMLVAIAVSGWGLCPTSAGVESGGESMVVWGACRTPDAGVKAYGGS